MTQAELSPQLNQNRLVMIDVLRGVAVFMVMVRHLAFNVTGFADSSASAVSQYPGDWFNEFAEFGEYGVHLFLTLSGFCIHFRWARTGVGSVPFFPFWKRRLIRLYPPFILALCISVLGLFVLHGIIRKSFPGGPVASWLGYVSLNQLIIDLILLFTLTQNLNGASQRIGNGPFWSLALEEQLYLMYFPFLWLRRNFGWTIGLVVPLMMTLVWRSAGVFIFDSPPQFWFVTAPAFWISWCLGAMAAEHSTGLITVPKSVSSPIVAGIALVMAVYWRLHSETISDPIIAAISSVGLELFIGFVWFQTVLLAVRVEPHARAALSGSDWTSSLLKPLSWLGMCSYSVYLLHDIAFTAVKQVCVVLELPLPVILCMRLGSGVLVGWLFYRNVEKYFHEKSQQVGLASSRRPGLLGTRIRED